MRASRADAGLLVAGLALVLIGWSGVLDRPGTAPPTAFGAAPPTVRPGVTAPPTTTPAETPAPSPSAPVAGVPTRLQFPALEIDAAVVPVAAAAQLIEPPPDPAVVGWWSASALAGATSGTTVLVGHVDAATSGPGALFPIGRGEVRAGQQLVVQYAGAAVRYNVTAQQIIKKSTGVPASTFTATGPPRLVLITCGGPFNRATKSYRDNIVVVLSPTD